MLHLLFMPTLVSGQPQTNLREGWAVLLEMDDYPGTGSDLPTGFSDSHKWQSVLATLGWQTHHIQLYQDSLSRAVGEAALYFLALNADANDVVLFYIFAHGSYIRNEMEWDDWFPMAWRSIASQEKLLVVSSCGSEAFIEPVKADSAGHVLLASARSEEYSWAGLPEEHLPIIGDVFNHFLTNALVNNSADLDADGEVVVEEAFEYALPLTRDYVSSVVFPAFPYFAAMCNNIAPTPVMDDGYTGNLSLQVEPGDPPITPGLIVPPELLLIGVIVTICAAVIIVGLYIRRRP